MAGGNSSSTERIIFLSQLRGLAALSVVFAHFLHNFFFRQEMVAGYLHSPPLQGLDTPLIAEYFTMIPSLSFGEFGVSLFFLISGFVIPLSLEKMGPTSFLVARIFRIWPTYVAGFLVSLLSFFIISWVYGHPFPFEFREIIVQAIIVLRDWLWFPNIDGIVWTLEVEVKFYFLMAFFYYVFGKIHVKKIAIFMVPLCLTLVACNNFTAIIYTNAKPIYYILNVITFNISIISFMLCGTVFYQFSKKKLNIYEVFLYLIIFLSCFALTWSYGIYVSGRFAIPHYIFALAFFSLCFIFKEHFRNFWPLDFLAAISYPLYVVHAAAGYSTLHLLINFGANETFALLAALIISFGLATILHYIVEKPSQVMGKKIAKRFN